MKKKRSALRVARCALRQSRQGFTLVELLVYMALVSVFLVVLTDIFVATLDVQTESQATSAVEQDGRFILARFANDIARAESINIPPQIGQTRNNLRITISGTTYDYSAAGGNLELSNNQGTNNLNSSETTISNLSFTRIANSSLLETKDTVQIQFTISSITQRPSGPEVRNFTTTVGRR